MVCLAWQISVLYFACSIYKCVTEFSMRVVAQWISILVNHTYYVTISNTMQSTMQCIYIVVHLEPHTPSVQISPMYSSPIFRRFL